MSTNNLLKVNTPSIFWSGCFIWSLAALFYFFDNLLNVSVGAMKPELSQAFYLSAAELGILSSCYLWPYAVMQIPAGLLMDSVGPRRVLTVASIFCAVGAWLFGVADSLLIACTGRACIGIGASFAVVGCSKIASVWFPPRRFALFMGLMVAVGMLGAAFGLATVSKIIQAFGWRESMYGGAMISVSLTVILWLIVRDKPGRLDGDNENVPEKIKQVPIMQGLVEVISCKQAWLVAIYAGLMFVPTLAFGGLWGIPFLVEGHGFSQGSAGIVVSLVFVGWIFGGPIYGWISDHMGRRIPPMYFSSAATLLISVIIIYLNNLSFIMISVLMFLLGSFSSGLIIAFAVTREKNRPEISGTAIGFINMLNTFSVALFQGVIGKVLDWTARDVVVSEAEKMFSLEDYRFALLSIPVCLVISLVMLVPIKETYCKPKHQ
jgi:sugar phosphate permease